MLYAGFLGCQIVERQFLQKERVLEALAAILARAIIEP